MNTQALVSHPATDSQATRSSLIVDVADPARGTRWEEFDRIYRNIVFGMARKAGLTHHDAEDLTQDVFRDLARSLCGFELRDRKGSFRRYLCNLVRWRIASAFGRRKPEAEFSHRGNATDTGNDPFDGIPAPESRGEGAETDFREAVTQALLVLSRDLSQRHVQLLDLYYCKEWPAKRVAAALHMRTATVFTIAHRNKLRLLREILRRL